MYGLLRAVSQRVLKLSEITVRELFNEGPTPCWAVVLIIDDSKTNKDGKLQYSHFMRNSNVFVCPVFFLSLYLFVR